MGRYGPKEKGLAVSEGVLPSYKNGVLDKLSHFISNLGNTPVMISIYVLNKQENGCASSN